MIGASPPEKDGDDVGNDDCLRADQAMYLVADLCGSASVNRDLVLRSIYVSAAKSFHRAPAGSPGMGTVSRPEAEGPGPLEHPRQRWLGRGVIVSQARGTP